MELDIAHYKEFMYERAKEFNSFDAIIIFRLRFS